MGDIRVSAAGLLAAVERSGYYPALVFDAVSSALGDDEVTAYFVHHEATFDPAMEVRRHVTVLVLTPGRLLVSHTDEHPPEEGASTSFASTTTESIRLTRVHSVAVSRVVPEPASYSSGTPPSEVTLSIGWGAISRVDLEPATCGDTSCDADHGYTGAVTPDDLALRVSAAADGAEAVENALKFAKALSETAG